MRTVRHLRAQHAARALLLACVLAIGGCIGHGPDLEKIHFHEARGAMVDVRLVPGRQPEGITGELLEVRDTLVVVLTYEVWIVPHRDIASLTTEQGLRTSFGNGRRDPSNLRLLSRFPYGMPASTLERILAQRAQAEPRSPTVGSKKPQSDATAESGTARFLQDARTATERYRDRAAAIADGYRKLGPAFPGMGEHWVHPGLIVSGRLDVRQPPVLCYVDSGGTTSLVAIAYAIPLRPGESPPDTPMGPSIWHQHGDAVDAEALLLVHRSPVEDATAPRLAMFHAWAWTRNPDGPFAQNNWALPFAQLGLDARDVTAAAGQALSLLTTGDAYYMRIFELIVDANAQHREMMQAGLGAATARVRQWLASRSSTTVDAMELRALEQVWFELWQGVDRRVDARTRKQLQKYPGRTRHEPH
ncbi:MAG: hypothetical protein ACRENP_15690 [Longimicrobiales bacterium]